MKDYIVRVDKNDNPIGKCTKEEAFTKGYYRRIARILIMNSKGQVLITKRSDKQFHGGGKWDQSAAGHVKPGETYEHAAHRELEEELSIKNINLELIGTFFTKNYTEHHKSLAFSQVFLGYSDSDIKFDWNEISDYKWLTINELKEMIENEVFVHSFTKTIQSLFAKLGLQ